MSRISRLVLAPLVILATVSVPCPASAETITVTSPLDAGPGTLREAIEAANVALTPATIDVQLASGGIIKIDTQLPAITRRGTVVLGNNVIVSGRDCNRPDGKEGCDGILVEGSRVTVRDITVTGFLFDGIAVRGGGRVHRVNIIGCTADGNQDDGISVSDGARRALIEDCFVVGNGFRTKGKGILVFQDASATIRNCFASNNRDGISITNKAKASLVSSVVSNSFDKGVGVSGARLRGHGNFILANGRGASPENPPPNADGLRVSLRSHVNLRDTIITENGDAGVIVLDDSFVRLYRGEITDNLGVGIRARDNSEAILRTVVNADNTGGAQDVSENATITVHEP